MISTSAALLVGCAASIPPPELIGARQAYTHASASPATQLTPADLYRAREALVRAEASFRDDPQSSHTQEPAQLAYRAAKQAEALGTTASDSLVAARADKEYEAARIEAMKNRQEGLTASERGDPLNAEQLTAEQEARLEVVSRSADAKMDLGKVASVKEDVCGLVIAVPAGVLFASNKTALSLAAQNRLKQVADALMTTKERKVTVEGHTDSRGSTSYNQELSQLRAGAVRSYIIPRGYPSCDKRLTCQTGRRGRGIR
jgi:outer membrane protein OmpA-like peptidoglycan-associated protein